MKSIFLLLFLSIISTTTYAQFKLSRSVGEQSPDIAITNWIENSPKDKSLKSKFVVLEFWATWCGPCLAAVPHVNDLREAFKENNDIVFLSMTYENVEKVQKTLKRVNFKSSVVTDTNKVTHKNFSADGSGSVELPYAVLIDKNQIIKWMGLPKDLTKEILDNFVNNKMIEMTQQITIEDKSQITNIVKQVQSEPNKTSEKIFDFQEVKNVGLVMSIPLFNKGKYKNTATTITSLFATLLNIPENLVIIPKSLQDKKYQINFSDTQQSDAKKVKNIILDSIMARLNLTHIIAPNDVSVYALTIMDKSKLDISKEEFSSESDTDDGVVFSNQTFNNISKSLSKRMNTFIEDKTQLDSQIDIIVNTKSIEQLEKSLNDYGISIEKTQKKMEAHTFQLR